MVFSTNQNRQLYVVTGAVNVMPATEGQFKAALGKDGVMYFNHYGAGGLTRSDLIPLKNIKCAKATVAEDMFNYPKVSIVKLDENINEGTPISGQDYILRIVIHSYVGMSDLEPYFKYGAVHALPGMTASKFYATLAVSLYKNFSRELDTMLQFALVKNDDSLVPIVSTTKVANLTDEYVGIAITEIKDKEWRRGIKAETPTRFDVIPTTVTYEGDEVTWGVVEDGDYQDFVDADLLNEPSNGKIMADLEYFCMGERADQYRGIGWPNNLDTQYLVDPAKNYCTIDIHFYFEGAGEQPHKSEKDITLLVEGDKDNKTLVNKVISNINTAAGSTLIATL